MQDLVKPEQSTRADLLSPPPAPALVQSSALRHKQASKSSAPAAHAGVSPTPRPAPAEAVSARSPLHPPSRLERGFLGGQEATSSGPTSALPEPRRGPGLTPLMWAGRDVDASARASRASRSTERKTDSRKAIVSVEQLEHSSVLNNVR